jgi:hypothetical protein
MKKMTLDYSKIKPLSEASHAKGINGRKVGKNNTSEWVWTMAAASFPRGAEFTVEQFKTALIEAMTYEAISDMIDKGEAIMTLNDANEIVMELI